MPLQFECNQDPKNMRSVNGKKFCDECKKIVYDVRRKSIEKIVDLKKEKNELCVIAYTDQLEAADNVLHSQTKIQNKKGILPLAGAAAISLITGNTVAQTRNAEGISIEKQIAPAPRYRTETSIKHAPAIFKGKITHTPFSKSKKQLIEIYYYDTISGDDKILFSVNSRRNGSFEFNLTEEMYKLLENGFAFRVNGRDVYDSGFELSDPDSEILLSLSRKTLFRRRTAGTYF